VTETGDSQLMRHVRNGRTSALATLFERHHARLYRFCLRMTGNRQAAEDLVQDVFMRMLKYRATFKDDSDFMPWMFGIARNACVAHLTRRISVETVSEADLDQRPAESVTETDSCGEEQADLIRRALLALPVDRREVLLLSRYEFKTYEEIARALGCSVGAVKVRAHRAIRQLREIYLDLAGEVPT
jgi:RNA polymerase sigma-70 factor (ECF subfamily)